MSGDGEGLDAATRAWLTERVFGGLRRWRAHPLPGGFTNEMVLLTGPDDERYVLRRYRPSATRVPRNPCAVELAVIRRAARAVPVADVVAADPHGRATGRPALVYRYVDASPLSEILDAPPPGEASDASPPREGAGTSPLGHASDTSPLSEGPDTSTADPPGLGHAVGAVLAALGTVTLPGPGLFPDAALVPADGRAPTADLPGFVEHCLATGRADGPLTARDGAALRDLARRTAHRAAAVADARHLVHGDFNPKNVLVTRRAGRWTVACVLDWELSFSGSPLVDVGNMLRFAHAYPPSFTDGFTAGFRDGGGHLPPGWRSLCRTLDLYALADILTAPPDAAYFARVRSVLLRHLAEDGGPSESAHHP
ncbi:phosphotransferase [Streptomyces sp. NPDC003077]|uniref:phosphotransferase family protein n=1 Tax=Streptomyces sp. NPDC003077 TaxID=3154443 RepID=UPI0033A41F55